MDPTETGTSDLSLGRDAAADVAIALSLAVVTIFLPSLFTLRSMHEFVINNIDAILLTSMFGSILAKLIALVRMDKADRKIIYNNLGIALWDTVLIFAFCLFAYGVVIYLKATWPEEEYRKLALMLSTDRGYWTVIAGLWGLAFCLDYAARSEIRRVKGRESRKWTWLHKSRR